MKDRHQLGLPDWLRSHPQAYAQAVERLVQAQRLGYWSASAADRQQLAGLYRELTQAQPLAQPLVGVQRWVEGQLQPLAAPTPMAVSVAPVRGDPQAPSAPARKGVVLQRQPPEPPPQTSLPEGLLLQALALEHARRPFDLERGPLVFALPVGEEWRKVGEKVMVATPRGSQEYEIVNVEAAS